MLTQKVNPPLFRISFCPFPFSFKEISKMTTLPLRSFCWPSLRHPKWHFYPSQSRDLPKKLHRQFLLFHGTDPKTICILVVSKWPSLSFSENPTLAFFTYVIYICVCVYTSPKSHFHNNNNNNNSPLSLSKNPILLSLKLDGKPKPRSQLPRFPADHGGEARWGGADRRALQRVWSSGGRW